MLVGAADAKCVLVTDKVTGLKVQRQTAAAPIVVMMFRVLFQPNINI